MVAMILHFTSVAQNESNESICTLFINNVILQKLGFIFGLQMACHPVQPNTFLFPNPNPKISIFSTLIEEMC